ncbi:MAG: DUF4394 domain-containing protein [Acidobacteria bacterium]|nr:DUF4394 domain-containing protein [Acidobacteriota bacterium]
MASIPVRDTLVRIGGVDGTPSPNGGQVTTIGAMGVNAADFGGFDIQPFTNQAYSALRVGGNSQLYSINLTTGAATLIGAIGNGTNTIDGIAVAPCATAAGVEVSAESRHLTDADSGTRPYRWSTARSGKNGDDKQLATTRSMASRPARAS